MLKSFQVIDNNIFSTYQFKFHHKLWAVYYVIQHLPPSLANKAMSRLVVLAF